ncbi:MAG: hypothetical protein R3A51_22525 [Nannocystaceae bacterium]
MPMTDEEKLRQLCEREREALVTAARMRTAMWATGIGVVGLIAGVYIGRDLTTRFFQDVLNTSS